MASGDIITSSYNSTTTGGYTVQPAVGVNIMITAMWSTAGYIEWRPTNSSGSSAMAMSGTNGKTSATTYVSDFGGNLKYFLLIVNIFHFILYQVHKPQVIQESKYNG